MWPKEHGAYGQMSFPLLTALVVAGVSVPALLLSAAIVAAFLAHEPLLVLLGRRGVRARREDGPRAVRWLTVTATVGLAAAAVAVAMASNVVRLSLAVPLVPAVGLAAAIVSGREKTTGGELMAALAFSTAAAPVVLAAGGSLATAAAVAAVFALVYTTQTLAVRGVILAVRGGGNPAASRASRRAALVIAVAGGAVIGTASGRGLLPSPAAIAMLPGLVATAWIVAAPPPPTRLRRVGWTLVATSVVTTLILIVSI